MRVAHPRRTRGGGSRNVHPAMVVIQRVSKAKDISKGECERERDLIMSYRFGTWFTLIEFNKNFYFVYVPFVFAVRMGMRVEHTKSELGVSEYQLIFCHIFMCTHTYGE
jgi:hypothetical protein